MSMRVLKALSLLATITPFAAAQNMVPTAGSGTFPACAVGCPILLQAQTVCTPPQFVVSTQQNYNYCFCQAPYLVDLYTTGETLCTSQCSATADRQLLSTWFVNLCAAVGASIGGTATATTLSTSTTSGTTQQTSAKVAAGTTSTSSTNHGPWISTHWQWLIMLLFLFFGLIGVGFGARWWKKRHDRQADAKRAAMSGFPVTKDNKVDRDRAITPDLWGPHQHMAATKGYQYTPQGALPSINEDARSAGNSTDKGKRASRVEVTEVQSLPPPPPSKTPDSKPT